MYRNKVKENANVQMKLLNLHKTIANFSENLIGAFIPLIILQQTGNMLFAILWLSINFMLHFAFNYLFRKQYIKRPQIMLLLRMATLTIYIVAILFIEANVWIAGGIICVFYAMDRSFKANSNEMILNYSAGKSSGSSSGKTIGITRLFEQIGVMVAVIAGGLFLDYINRLVLVVCALTIYFISVIPLVMYYVKHRKSQSFNKESISNAMLSFATNEAKSKAAKKVAKKILLGYLIAYVLFFGLDVISNTFTLFLFQNSGSFSVSGYFSATYNGCFGLSAFFAGKLNDKKDTTFLVSICCVVIGVCCVLLPFIPNMIVLYVLFATIGLAYPPISIFLLDRMLVKARVLGISNKTLFMRDTTSVASRPFALLAGAFGTLIPIFFVACIGMAIMSVYIPMNEEKTRKQLVKYLEN